MEIVERKCCNWTKIPLNEVMCLALGLFLSNLMAKLDEMVKVVLALKLNNQSGSFYNLMTKIVSNQNFSGHLDRVLSSLLQKQALKRMAAYYTRSQKWLDVQE